MDIKVFEKTTSVGFSFPPEDLRIVTIIFLIDDGKNQVKHNHIMHKDHVAVFAHYMITLSLHGEPAKGLDALNNIERIMSSPFVGFPNYRTVWEKPI